MKKISLFALIGISVVLISCTKLAPPEQTSGEGSLGTRKQCESGLIKTFTSGIPLLNGGKCIGPDWCDGCNTFIYCVKCGDGICRKEFGEHSCNCPEDCGEITEEMYCDSFLSTENCPKNRCRLKGAKTGEIAQIDKNNEFILNSSEGYKCIPINN